MTGYRIQDMILSGISNTTRFLILVCIIFIEISSSPFLDLFAVSKFYFDILNTTILISIVFALNQNKRYVVTSALLVTPLILSIWLSRVSGLSGIVPVGLFFSILFFIYTAIHILKFILSREYVSLDVILGAIAVYLMMGMVWAISYGFLEIINPDSFNFGSHRESLESYTFIYYSFVTLTTLGYGDITPATPIAQSLTIVEALIGQIYLVVVIAWLVGMFTSEKRLKNQNRSQHPEI